MNRLFFICRSQTAYRYVLFIFFLIAAKALYGQRGVGNSRMGTHGSKPAIYYALSSTCTFEDFGLGTALGGMNRKRTMAYFATFEARPYRKRVLVRAGGNDFYQFKEERYMLGVGTEYLKGFASSDKGVFVQLNANYTWGEWGGTERGPKHGFVLTPRAGMYLNLGQNGLLKLGYSYQDVKSDDITIHRVYLCVAGFTEIN